jgi:hypothetical protein
MDVELIVKYFQKMFILIGTVLDLFINYYNIISARSYKIIIWCNYYITLDLKLICTIL